MLLQFILLKPGSERARLLPVMGTMLQLSPEEKARLAAAAQGAHAGHADQSFETLPLGRALPCVSP